ncbi:type I restriction endonuclease subunit R [Kitasatospora purpeofusca]|uniref:type I restriction endonuclease subunit R n=1 Tax=Kitasatospora purpeofusca TaxID=67352 RepID=UPI0036E83B65
MAAPERDEVERPLIAQLVAMGWTHVPGKDVGPLDHTEPVLRDRLAAALTRLTPELTAADTAAVIRTLVSVPLALRPLLDANLDTTELLLHGCSAQVAGKQRNVQYVAWNPAESHLNEFTVVNQLRVRSSSGAEKVLDLVLFVNGIPLAVVECKSPELADPVGEAIRDLHAYAGTPTDTDDRTDPTVGNPRSAGVPGLFRTAQLLVAAAGRTAYLGTVGAGPAHFHPWRASTLDPAATATARRELGDAAPERGLNEQQVLAAAVLRPQALLNVVRHYVIPMPVSSGDGPARLVKTVARYQQFRAVEKAVHKLRTGRTLLTKGVEADERGGVIWHTQGSGKSLTMAFLARRIHMHFDDELNRFMVVVVTDRTQLQRQLAPALALSGSEVVKADTRAEVEGLLSTPSRRVVFAMIQKYRGGNAPVLAFVGDAEADGDGRELTAEKAEQEEAEDAGKPAPFFPLCSDSTRVLFLVDEAHRSHTSVLHGCLRQAVPNAARIGFTGTPIVRGGLQDTSRIFGLEPGGGFLDTYRTEDAERDGVVVRVRYEGRTGDGAVLDADTLDGRFEDLVRDRTPAERAALLRRWPTERDVAESLPMIQAKARDMLAHWVTHVLPGEFKAQVAAVSRQATVAYRDALDAARNDLVASAEMFDPAVLRGRSQDAWTPEERLLFAARRFLSLLRRIDFVPVISAGKERKSGKWTQWTDEDAQRAHVERFLRPFPQFPPDDPWAVPAPAPAMPAAKPLIAPSPFDVDPPATPEPERPVAFLIVKSMLLTGFDAPNEQVLYLDRPIRDAELLQAVARVNRPAPGKQQGYVVDYYGVLGPLSDALAAYDEVDRLSAMRPLSDEIPELAEAAESLRAFVKAAELGDLGDMNVLDRAALRLEDAGLREEFDDLLARFTAAMERVLPHEAALAYVGEAAEWAQLQKRVRRLYRDDLDGVFTLRRYGRKVRALIADHLEGPEIDQVIAPVLITSVDFDAAVRRIREPRVAAAEMRHALRFHLEEYVRKEDPKKYRRLSRQLEEVLEEFKGRWEDQIVRFGALIDEARTEESGDPLTEDLTALERGVHALLVERLTAEAVTGLPPAKLPVLSILICDIISDSVVKVAYQGRSQDISALAGRILVALRRSGVRAADKRDLSGLDAIAQRLAAHGQAHKERFTRRTHGQ